MFMDPNRDGHLGYIITKFFKFYDLIETIRGSSVNHEILDGCGRDFSKPIIPIEICINYIKKNELSQFLMIEAQTSFF